MNLSTDTVQKPVDNPGACHRTAIKTGLPGYLGNQHPGLSSFPATCRSQVNHKGATKMFKRSLLAAAVFAASLGLASASGFSVGGDATGYMGTGGGYANSATTGGSMAQGNVNGTGYSVQHSSNVGGGFAGSTASVLPNGVFTATVGGSTATNFSAGIAGGQAQGSTGGAVGSDISSGAWGSFQTGGFGGSVNIGGDFGDFTGGCTGPGNSCGNHGWGDHSNGNGQGHNNGNH